jgi:hypothetical protein
LRHWFVRSWAVWWWSCRPRSAPLVMVAPHRSGSFAVSVHAKRYVFAPCCACVAFGGQSCGGASAPRSCVVIDAASIISAEGVNEEAWLSERGGLVETRPAWECPDQDFVGSLDFDHTQCCTPRPHRLRPAPDSARACVHPSCVSTALWRSKRVPTILLPHTRSTLLLRPAHTPLAPRLHARSPRMRRASWMSLGMSVTRLA